MYYLKSKVCTCALVVYMFSFSRTEGYLSEFLPSSPAACGNTKIINGDSSFSISEMLSSEGRRKSSFNVRSKERKYSSSPSLHTLFDSYPPPSFRKEEGSYNPYKHDPRLSFKANLYNHKLSNVYSKADTEDDSQTNAPPPSQEADNFPKFMMSNLARSFGNDKRIFPAQFARTKTTRKSKIKRDMVRGLPVIVEGKKKVNSSHADHKDTPSRLPPMIQHILDKNKGTTGKPAVELIKVSPSHPAKYYTGQISTIPKASNAGRSLGDEGRPIPMGQMGMETDEPMASNGGGNARAPWTDGMGSLGPDKIQKLKQLLDKGGDRGSDFERSARRAGYGEGDNRMRGGPRGEMYEMYEDGSRSQDDRRHHPQAYNLDTGDGADFRHRKPYGTSNEQTNFQEMENIETGERPVKGKPFETIKPDSPFVKAANNADVGSGRDTPMNPKEPDLDYADYPSIPEAVMPGGSGDKDKKGSRSKRSASLEDISRYDQIGNRADRADDDGVKTCTWSFRRGPECKRMVVKMHYWIDGARDCNQEYLLISGSGRQEERFCGGQEDLTPYIVEGDKVIIEHFKETTVGKAVAKFKATIKCG